MSQTLEETRLFASLWLNTGGGAVLTAQDARDVAIKALERVNAVPTPCARDPHPIAEHAPKAARPRTPLIHSSWVH